MGIPLGDVVMLVGVASLLNNVVQPFAGWIMGRRNLAWTLWFSVLLASASVWMGWMPNFFWLCVVILAGAAGTGLFHPEAALSASDATGEKAYLGIPLFMAGGGTIYAIVTPLSIRVAERFGFESIAWLALPGIAVAGLLFASYQRRKREHPSVVIRPRSRRITKVGVNVISFWPLLATGFCLAVANGLFLAILSSHYELLFGSGARRWAGWTLMVLGILASILSFVWSGMGRKHGFYVMTLATQAVAFPLFLLMAWPVSPAWGFALAFPLGLVTPATIHPMAVGMARNAAGSTQALRTALMMGATYGLSAVATMVAGVLLRRGVSSSWIILFVAFCALGAALLSAWQLVARRRISGT
jgi:MFS family permease